MKSLKLDLMNVLYVQDICNVCENTISLFKETFDNFDLVHNKSDSLSRVNEKKYEIIILDFDTEVESILNLLDEVKRIDPEVSVVVTGSELDPSMLEPLQKYVDGYLFNKYSNEEIIQVLDKVFHNRLAKTEFNKLGVKFSEKLDQKVADLEYKQVHDKLTNLYNYYAFSDKINSVKNADVILLNIDNFDAINGIYGFDIGDAVLVEASKMLKLIKPVNFQLFRLYGDEFAFIDEECMDKSKLTSILESIVSFFNVSEMHLEDDIDIKISFSIGVSNGSGFSTLNKARIAIKELRKHTRGSYNFFDSNSTCLKRQKNNIYWIHKIKEALADRRIFPYYQPVMNNHTLEVEKYECLARIEEDKVLIPPIRFMEAAKLTGMLSFITKTMIEQSCENFRDNDYQFSINITNDDLNMGYLKDFLLRHTKKNNIHPSRIILEILEDVASINEDVVLEQLHSLREEGFKIAIDDFGSEYSNFSRLLDFHPDYLKIDGSFIKNIIHCEKSQIIVEAIVLLAHKSNIKIIAEYVHNEVVQEKVKELGIDYSQGFYFSEPKAHL